MGPRRGFPESVRDAALRSRTRAGRLVLTVEPEGTVRPEHPARAMTSSVADAVGTAPNQVLVLPRDSIPKTTSGKLRRSALRTAPTAVTSCPWGAVPRRVSDVDGE